MLTGEFVTLRAGRENDVEALYEQAAELATWEERNPTPPRPLALPEFAERFNKSLTERSDDVSFVIEVGSEVVGHVRPVSSRHAHPHR